MLNPAEVDGVGSVGYVEQQDDGVKGPQIPHQVQRSVR